jgi:hypothetical protein
VKNVKTNKGKEKTKVNKNSEKVKEKVTNSE